MLSDTAGQRGRIYLRFVVNLTALYSVGGAIALRNQLFVEAIGVVHPDRPPDVARHFLRGCPVATADLANGGNKRLTPGAIFLMGLAKEEEA